jgi:tRNA(Arg) A34 adenosine deaminase TadA
MWEYDPGLMRRAIELSRRAVSTPGAEPFGAVVVKNGRIVGEGFNRSKASFDPTSHGEVEAIRDACRRLQTVDLSGCELYSSCEPCAICVATMTAVGIGKLYYAASLRQAGEALSGVEGTRRHSRDPDLLRSEAGKPPHERLMPAEQHQAAEALIVLREWAAT